MTSQPLSTQPAASPSSNGCSCCAPASGLQIRRPAAASGVSTDYAVDGMTCNGCATSVTDAIRSLDGVTDVQVTLSPGQASTVTVQSSVPLAETAVRDAVSGAGYRLVGRLG